MPDNKIVVRVAGKGLIRDENRMLRYFPKGEPVWGRCEFVFNDSAQQYDWLVAYDELPHGVTRLRCPRQHTLLVTAEPASIKVYGSAYLRQFGHVLTSQEPYAIRHPGVIRSHPALKWYIGIPPVGSNLGLRTYDQMKFGPPVPKDAVVSTVCSNKMMSHTLHRLRYDFTQALKAAMPDLDVFGRGVREIDDKAEALDRYKYHIAIENHVAPHHITEKLTDVFLGNALPIYFGAPNAADYFPKESFIPIDIRDTRGAIDVIRCAVNNNEYEKRLDAIREAKRLTLDEHNLFAVLARHIERLDTGRRGPDGGKLVSRRVFRNRNPIGAAIYLAERYRVQARVKREAAAAVAQ